MGVILLAPDLHADELHFHRISYPYRLQIPPIQICKKAFRVHAEIFGECASCARQCHPGIS
jgi:hypothetical protein